MWTSKKAPFYALTMGLVLFINASQLSMSSMTSSISILSDGTIGLPGVSQLHTLGYHIYNSSGGRFNLYCPSIHYGGQAQHVELSDILAIKALGFGAFRLGIYWGLIQPYNETMNGVDVTYFTTPREPLGHGLDEVVNWAVQEDLYIELCLCWTAYWAPPSWAFPGISDFGQRYASLINGTAYKERTGLVNTWQYIAGRYSNIPNVIFEFLNEPEIPPGQESLAGDAYRMFNEEIITAIESVETMNHLKIVELLLDSSSWVEILPDASSNINKPNTLWASHTYVPMNGWDPADLLWIYDPFTWNGQFFDRGWHNQTVYVAWRLIRMAERVHELNEPWINTEFGKEVTQPYWDVWLDLVLQVSKDYDITGWAIFTYCPDADNSIGFNIKNPTTQPLVMGILRPYMIQPLL